MIRRHLLVLTAVVCTALALVPSLRAQEPTARTEAVAIPTDRDVELVGAVHHPAEPNGVIVVIGSGRGYHKDLPLLLRTAEELQAVGFTVVRFDWAYFTAKGEPAADLATELLDLEAAITYARGLPDIDELYLAGKSLGSIAATLRVTKRSDDVAGVMLLTLPVAAAEKPDEVFDEVKPLQALDKPIMIVCGDRDPYSSLTALYRFAGGFERAPRLVIVPGDHGMHGPDKDPARTAENVELAARGVALWAQRWQQAE